MDTSKKQPRFAFSALARLAILALIAAACVWYLARAANDEPRGAAGKASSDPTVTLVFARGKDSLSLDPADIDDGESVKVTVNLFDSLLRYQRGSTAIEPALASAWDVSTDGLSFTFQLRKGVAFHDGTPFNAEAVVFSFRRQMDPNHPANFAKNPYWATMYHMVESIEALGEREVVIRLSVPHGPFLTNLAMFPVGIVSPTAVARQGRKFKYNPVGTGPFRFVEWKHKERIVLEANDEYWDGRPRIDRLIFIPMENNSNRLNSLLTGQADGMDGVSPADLGEVRGDARFHVYEAAGMNVRYLAMNCQRPPFTDARVRRAVAMTIDRAALVSGLYRGAAVPAVHPLPPTIWGYPAGAAVAPPDIEGARKLLIAAGWLQKQPVELHTMTNPRPYMPQPSKVAQAIKAQLARIGMAVKIVEHTWNEHLELTKRGAHQMALLGWIGDNGDPDNFLYVLLGSANTTVGTASNISFYKSAVVDQLLVRAQRLTDQAERTRLYQQALAHIQRDAPLVPLVHARQVVVFRKDVANFRLHPTGILRFHKVGVHE